jgi:tetratricopeptide (TPR) repeat protein
MSRDWILGLSLVLAVILAYQPIWRAGFIWDDDLVVTANPCIVGPLGLKEIWTTSAADICPLTLTAFWMEYALWGSHPLPYHLVNVLLHGAGAVLLWRVLRSLQIPGAWMGAALWALHPVEVESVAWITEMKNTLSGVFFLLTILFFVKGLGSRSGRNHGLTLPFAALAMASKTSTAILPVVLCLCAWWMEGRWHWRNLARVTPIFLMSIAAAALSIWTQRAGGANDPQWARSWPERLASAGDAVWFYLGKLLWPHPLIMVYPRWQIDAGQWFSYLPLAALIAVLVILWLKRESWSRPWFFAFAYFLVALLPALGLVNMSFFRYSLVADHFQYLAGMGPLALAGAGLVRLSSVAFPGRRWLQPGICAALPLIFGSMSWQRTGVYESHETLWTDTLAKNPDCWLGRNNLGNALAQKGRLDEAVEQLQKALELNPSFAEAHYNLGHVLVQKGQMDEAIAQYQKALELNPDYPDAHYNLGNVLVEKGQVDEAIAQYQKALQLNPNFVRAYNNLGFALFTKGQPDEAIAQYQKALGISPNFADAHYNLGVALVQRGQLDEAIAQFQEAVRLNPDNTSARNNLARAQAMARHAPVSK